LVRNDEGLQTAVLKRIQVDLKARQESVPAHQLQPNISQETLLLVDIFKQSD